jgi:hypothetical protein
MFDNCLTSSVRFKQPQKLLTGSYMKEQTINTREFLRNYKKFSTANKVIIVSSHGKPEGVFVPYEKWKKENKRKSRTITLEDIEKYTGNLPGSDPDLSQRIDEIVYTYPNKLTKNRKK